MNLLKSFLFFLTFSLFTPTASCAENRYFETVKDELECIAAYTTYVLKNHDPIDRAYFGFLILGCLLFFKEKVKKGPSTTSSIEEWENRVEQVRKVAADKDINLTRISLDDYNRMAPEQHPREKHPFMLGIEDGVIAINISAVLSFFTNYFRFREQYQKMNEINRA